jgi:tRNA 2-thiouridine synthesizing protein E
MPMMEFQGKQIEVDDDGYIINLDDWTKDLAEHLASLDNMTLTPSHWEVIDFLRNYYKQYQIAPMIKILVKEIERSGSEKATQNIP